MSENIVIYCKSFSRDVKGVKNLYESIQKHNVDNIPFYVSVPKRDIGLFRDVIGSEIQLIEDESIYDVSHIGESWYSQQIVKSNFWKLGLTANYLCIDSEFYFIRDFYKKDFLVKDNIPYTVMHQQKELFEWGSAFRAENIKHGFNTNCNEVRSIFDRSYGVNYDFGPGPIWSSRVWNFLELDYLVPNGINFENLIQHVSSEFTWYGEFLLASKCIELHPIQPLFKVFHYPGQYYQFKNVLEIKEQDIASEYLGICLNSNWASNYRY